MPEVVSRLEFTGVHNCAKDIMEAPKKVAVSNCFFIV
jgi:hypothetical protein